MERASTRLPTNEETLGRAGNRNTFALLACLVSTHLARLVAPPRERLARGGDTSSVVEPARHLDLMRASKSASEKEREREDDACGHLCRLSNQGKQTKAVGKTTKTTKQGGGQAQQAKQKTEHGMASNTTSKAIEQTKLLKASNRVARSGQKYQATESSAPLQQPSEREHEQPSKHNNQNNQTTKPPIHRPPNPTSNKNSISLAVETTTLAL